MLWAVAQGGVMWLAMARDEEGGWAGRGRAKALPVGAGVEFLFPVSENGTGLRKVISTGAHSELYGGICQVVPRNPGTRLRKVVAGVYFSQSSATLGAKTLESAKRQSPSALSRPSKNE